MLSARTFCADEDIMLYLLCLVQWQEATCGHGAFEMCLLELRKQMLKSV